MNKPLVYLSWILLVTGFLAWYISSPLIPDFQDWELSSHPYSVLFDYALLVILKWWGIVLLLAAATGFMLNYVNPEGFLPRHAKKIKAAAVIGLVIGIAISGTILSFVPHELSVSVSGPSVVYDGSPTTVSFSSTVSGGQSPLKYQWSISTDNLSDMQTYATSNLHDTAISVSFSANTSQFYTYGRNVTYQISLTVTDSNGFQDSSSIGVQVRDP